MSQLSGHTTSCYRFHTVTSDVLTAVKKMEDSLKRLKKGRSAEKERSQGMSDDDKIRQQLIVDIGFYGDQVSHVTKSILKSVGSFAVQESTVFFRL